MIHRFVPALLLALSLGGPALAAGKAVEPVSPSGRTDAACASVAVLAENMMLARQAGVSLAEALSLVEGNALFRGMVLMAWESPQYMTAPMQQAEVNRFRDLWHLQCLRG
jgi:hypothetical protein